MKHTWTDHLYRCSSCGQLARLSVESLAVQRRDFDWSEATTDAQIAASLDLCLHCVDGELPEYEGEHAHCHGVDGETTEVHDDGKAVEVCEVRTADDVSNGVTTWTRRVLCTGCLADARFLKVLIRGEWSADYAEHLVDAFADAQFECGEDSDVDAPYEVLNARAVGTRAALMEHVGLFTGLTPRDWFAIAAALDVAADDEDEPYPGIHDANEKVKQIRAALLAEGARKPLPETSAQSQAYIDGASPWRYEADGAVDISDDEGVLGALNAQYPPEHEAPSADATGAR